MVNSALTLTNPENYDIILVIIIEWSFVMAEIGKKFSLQRKMIYEQVRDYPIHPTADEVYTALKAKCPNLSLGTVYRNLNLLAEMGMVLKIHTGSDKERFDGRTDPHCHFFCEKCRRVFDVEDESIHDIKTRVLHRDGHIVSEADVNLRGICRECSNILDE